MFGVGRRRWTENYTLAKVQSVPRRLTRFVAQQACSNVHVVSKWLNPAVSVVRSCSEEHFGNMDASSSESSKNSFVG